MLKGKAVCNSELHKHWEKSDHSTGKEERGFEQIRLCWLALRTALKILSVDFVSILFIHKEIK